MEKKKISELIEAESVNDDDILMVIQNGINKKTKAKNVGTGRRRSNRRHITNRGNTSIWE